MKYFTIIPPITIKNLIFYKYDFRVVFDGEFYLHIKSELQNNLTTFNLKKFLLLWIEYCIEKAYKFSHLSEIIITTVSNKKNMTYEFYNKQPMKMIELNLDMIIESDPYLINALDRIVNYPLIRKYRNIPCN